jgi:hypothetical protein
MNTGVTVSLTLPAIHRRRDTSGNFTPVGIATNNVDLGKDVIVGVMDTGGNFTNGG